MDKVLEIPVKIDFFYFFNFAAAHLCLFIVWIRFFFHRALF